MTATSDQSGVVALTERLLSESRHSGVGEGDGNTPIASSTTSLADLDAEKPKGLGDDVQFNFENTFRFMTQRRLQRRYRGVYKQYSFTAQLMTWLVVLYTLSVLATLAFKSNEIDLNDKSTTSTSVFVVVLIIVAVFIFVQLALVIRWMVYWVLIAVMLVYIVTNKIESAFWLDKEKNSSVKLTSTQKRARDNIMICLLAVEVLTLAIYIFTHYTYPWLVINNKFDTIKWWNVVRDPVRGNTLTYISKARSLYTSKRNVITYCGGLDDQCQPHGFGMWTDTSFHGERLTGQWDHGIPVAPYRSFERGSGYCFVNVRVGYCHVRAEDGPEDVLYFPKHSTDGLHWGVGSVECSVSGGFFTFLPSVRHLTPYNGTGDDTPKNAADCELILRSPTDNVVLQDEPKPHEPHRKHVHPLIKRFPSARGILFKENSLPMLDQDVQADVVVPNTEGGKEALILLHGYNCPLDYGMNRLAQLLALGDFPTRIHPFVFSWPSGGTLAYFQAKAIGSESDETAQGFRDFLRSLVEGGYTTIHILAHSMGARVYFSALKKGYLDDVFERDDDDDYLPDASMPTRRARLATLTFTNADYERNEFVKRDGSYDKSRRFCRCITVYADNMDGALFYSELLGKGTFFGPLNYSLGKRGHMLHRDPDDCDDDVADNDDGSTLHHNIHNLTPTEMDSAVALINQRGNYEGVCSFAFNDKRRNASPTESETRLASVSSQDQPLQYLDIDVIDTTWMDNNVHAIRHNYFNLNPTVVDDLRYLIVEQQRASSRPGILKTTENVYIFLVAPSHVKNK